MKVKRWEKLAAVFLGFCLGASTFVHAEPMPQVSVVPEAEIVIPLPPPPAWNFETRYTKDFADATVNGMKEFMAKHYQQVRETGVGLLYGVLSQYAALPDDQKIAYIETIKKPGTMPPMPEPTSCISWVYKNLQIGFAGIGRLNEWEQIEAYLRSRGSDGIFLAQELQRLGWETVYWNADVDFPADNPEHHRALWDSVQNTHTYFGIKIDHMMLNFRPSPDSTTQADNSGLDKLAQVPIWFGLANGAYHTFLGYGDHVNESHSPLNPEERRNIVDSRFKFFGATSKVKYLSGVIVVPPKTWKARSNSVSDWFGTRNEN